MNEQDAKKRIDELVKLLNYHSQLYYVEDRNEITDYEYDMLQQELKGLEEQFAVYQKRLPYSTCRRQGDINI